MEDIQPYAWDPVVLCATYRGLCDACHWVRDSSVLSRHPLLLQLWSFECFHIGQPQLDLGAYAVAMYAEDDDVDQPTLCTVSK